MLHDTQSPENVQYLWSEPIYLFLNWFQALCHLAIASYYKKNISINLLI